MSAIQVKDVPQEIHDQARARAEALGCSLGEYILSAIRKDLRIPLRAQWKEELLKRPVVEFDSDLALEILRAARKGER